MLNKFLGIAPFDIKSDFHVELNNNYHKISKIILGFCVFATAFELCETIRVSGLSNSFFFDLMFRVHFFGVVIIDLIFLIYSLCRQDVIKKIYVALYCLLHKKKVQKSKKYVQIYTALSLIWLILILLIIGARTSVRIFSDFETPLMAAKTTIYILSGVFGFFFQNYIVYLFVNYTNLAKMFIEDLNESLLQKDIEIGLIRKYYEEVWDFVESLKNGFSFYLFMTAASAFNELVFLIFYLMSIPIYYKSVIYVLNPWHSFVLVMWAMVTSGCLFAAVVSCENLAKEVSLISLL